MALKRSYLPSLRIVLVDRIYYNSYYKIPLTILTLCTATIFLIVRYDTANVTPIRFSDFCENT